MVATMGETVFGRVLGELMEVCGLDATPEEVVRLGYCSRLDGRELLRYATRRASLRWCRRLSL